MSESPRLRLNADEEKMTDDKNEAPSASPVDDAEKQMRRALGLYGGTPKARFERERRDTQPRANDRSGNLFRRRFVQDGEVPVTVIRRDPSAEAYPSPSRAHRAEAALADEVAARKHAERSLAEAQAQILDLQTKLGHAELAEAEAAEMARRDREAAAGQRAAGEEDARAYREAIDRAAAAERKAEALKASLRQERAARATAEPVLALAEDAQRAYELPAEASRYRVGRRSEGYSTPVASRSPTRKPGRSATAKKRDPEPQPVKWWLTPAKGVKRK